MGRCVAMYPYKAEVKSWTSLGYIGDTKWRRREDMYEESFSSYYDLK